MSRNAKKILYVEDDQDIRVLAEMIFDNSPGQDLRLCESGEEAFSVLKGFCPDVILLDVMLPGMDGLTIIKRLKGRPETADIPVIFVTARVQASEMASYLDLGAIGVIEKPFDPIELPAFVDQLLDRSRSRQTSVRRRPTNAQDRV